MTELMFDMLVYIAFISGFMVVAILLESLLGFICEDSNVIREWYEYDENEAFDEREEYNRHE